MNQAIIVALIAATPPTAIALMTFLSSRRNAAKIQEFHVMLNSRMDEMLKLTKLAAFHEGEKAAEDRALADAATFAAGEKSAKDKADGIK